MKQIRLVSDFLDHGTSNTKKTTTKKKTKLQLLQTCFAWFYTCFGFEENGPQGIGTWDIFSIYPKYMMGLFLPTAYFEPFTCK